MRDEIVDIGLMAVATFIQKGRAIDYTGTIRGLGTQDSECCMQRKRSNKRFMGQNLSACTSGMS